MRCKGYRCPPFLSHTLTVTSTHTHTYTHVQFIYLFFSRAVPGTDGQFHGHVCELLGWVNQTVLWGKEKEGEVEGQSEREEAYKGRGQNTHISDRVALLCTQRLVFKLTVFNLNLKRVISNHFFTQME